MKFSIAFVRYLLLLLIIWILQSIVFNRLEIINFIRVLMGITIPYIGIRILGKKFVGSFLVVMIIITSISFVFYIPSSVSSSFYKTIGKISPALGTDIVLNDRNFVLFTYMPKGNNGFLRNAGNFSEPGYFACYLALALVLNIMYLGKINSRINLLFILGLISTLSTAAYLVLFFILFFFILQQKNKLISIVLLPLVIGIGFFSFTKLEFLEKKITMQIQTQSVMNKTVGRFGSTLRNLKEIKKNPIIGKGITKKNRFNGFVVKGDNFNGFETWENLNSHSNLLVVYGIPGFLLYTFWLFKGFKNFIYINKLNRRYWFLLVGSFYLVLAAQPIISTPFFMSFLFWERRNYENINNNT